jgi:protein-histidine pros-kinase
MLFGYRRAELLGKPIEMLMPERNQGQYRSRLEAFMAKPCGTPGQAVEFQGVRNDGSEFPIEVSLCAFATERGVMISTAIRDVTERKRIEASLAEASKAKSDFLNSMSHELRTPLNAILGFAQLLQTDRENTLTAKQQEYVGYVRQGGEHLLSLVSQLLDLVAIEKDRLELCVERIDVWETLKQVYGLTSTLAQANGIVLELSLPDKIGDVFADEFRLRQALLNLLSNAIKYNRPGGTVSLAALPAADGRIRFSITDTGIGIPFADQEELFKPFQRFGVNRSGIGGTGIGLALARKLIEAMNGAIGFASQPGQGSVFWVELPATAAAAPAVAFTEKLAISN